jgi:hypothetical protein
MPLVKHPQHRRQVGGHGVAYKRDSQQTEVSLPGAAGGFNGMFRLRDRPPGFFEENRARFRHPHAALIAIEQPHTQGFFQTLNGLGEWRLRHLQAFRRPPEMQFFGDRDELPKLTKFDHGEGATFGISNFSLNGIGHIAKHSILFLLNGGNLAGNGLQFGTVDAQIRPAGDG